MLGQGLRHRCTVRNVAYASEPEFLVLHALRLKGFAEPGAISAATGVLVEDVDKFLGVFEDDGLVVHRVGRVSGWTLTALGREADERQAAEELDASGERASVLDAYRRFLELNPDVLQLCTDWQLRTTPSGPVVNDHTDAAYDHAIVDRLADLDAAAQPVCADLGAALERLDGYGDRLATASSRVRAGEKDWFAKPTIDSYHTVWFELHENLLATLGIERGKETG